MPPKKRDYKAEYAQRIARGMAKGQSRSVAGGHPRPGETPARSWGFRNPFRTMRDAISRMVGELGSLFGQTPSPSQIPRSEVVYVDSVGEYGINTLPRWSVGDDTSQPNEADLRNLMTDATTYRYQPSYAVVICGMTAAPYPNKEGEVKVCLTYRLDRSSIMAAVNNPNNRDLEDIVNEMLPDLREEEWVEIDQIQVIDKD